MSDKKNRVLGNEIKLKSIKKDRSYFQRLDNKETPERDEATVIDVQKRKPSPAPAEDFPVLLPIGGLKVAS